MGSSPLEFIEVAFDLEHAGLYWQPEIGDEILVKQSKNQISILIDPAGLTPNQLRSRYLWLPSVEQMVVQFESRQAIVAHVGLELDDAALWYRTVIKSQLGEIECKAETMRLAVGFALRDLLLFKGEDSFH